jgi:DNA-binding transcriptional MerR regulator
MAKLPEKIPVKIYYNIREVSDYTGVEPHVLRYWETKFAKLRPKRVGGNQRKYTRTDLELIFEIIRLLYQEGYTLDGAERRLKYGAKGAHGEPEAPVVNLEALKKSLEEIVALVG